MIVYGTRHVGTINEIEGVGCIKTRFAHIWFIPLVPLGSMFVVEEKGDSLRGLNMPVNGRSVLAAWGRTWVMLSTVGLLVGAGAGLLDLGDVLLHGKGFNDETVGRALMSLCIGGGSCFGLIFNITLWWAIGRFWGKANPEREAELRKRLGLSPASAPGNDDDVLDGAAPLG